MPFYSGPAHTSNSASNLEGSTLRPLSGTNRKLELHARSEFKFRAQKSTPEGAFCSGLVGRSCLAGCISGGYPAEGGAAAGLSLTVRLDGPGFGLAPVVLPEHCRPGR